MDRRPRPPAEPPRSRPHRDRLLILGTLLALGLGILLGVLSRGIDTGWVPGAVGALEASTAVWVDLLRLLVVPLVVGHLYLAVRRLRGAPELGGIGLASIAAFAILVVLGNALALGGAFAAFSAYLPELSLAGAAQPATAVADETVADPGVPARVLDALGSSSVLLGAMAAAILLGLLSPLLSPSGQRRLDALGERASTRLGAVFHAFLLATPVAAFSLALTFSARHGMAMAGALAWYLAVLCGLLLAQAVLLLLIGALAADVRLRTWCAAVLPAQLLAVATRSSLATVPPLLEAGRELRLPERTTDVVVPLAASTFKPSTAVSGTTTLVFLSIAFDVPLSVTGLLGFIAFDALISVADLGVPKLLPQMKSMPLYLALGMPLEGYVLARSAAVFSDVFKTVTNTTGYLTVTGMVIAMRARRRVVQPAVEGQLE